ncbi:ImmA/IrrE family metallo-endopeptidase [Rhizobium rhizogenes]|uniref:ImmA/IrrE family metallo-endopeptidase n=1 Tax=Rhizobium rhizogenes TaxID=359 RepID=UPI001572025A|nr:ImmA/IrrE family metallo-endopeptidase [Rhizobium rhizogenes]NTF64918.1 ImmA/IrrE family metallo-endopeptidase [Rhizobium rhizogenes]NTG96266.1 ImmA/IrrE family metallo-endopeptidase [Rhizobium rhizogenes]
MSFEPNWASAPGATIVRLMEAREIPFDEMASGLSVSEDQLQALIDGRARIDGPLASALSENLGSTPRFWLARDKTYVEELSRLAPNSGNVSQWIKSLPISSMRKFGWIGENRTEDAIKTSVLSFFGCGDLLSWNAKYSSGVGAVAFRTSFAFEANEMATLVWLRAGERQAHDLDLPSYNRQEFIELLPRLRKLSAFKHPKTFLPRLIEACRIVGVALTTARAPEGCRASGASWFLSSRHPIIHLSFRHLSEDHFWFTFFHEAAHVVLHGEEHIDVEGSDPSLQTSSTKEDEADEFAQSLLISVEALAELKRNPAPRKIVAAARNLGITAGIIVGQLEKADALLPGRLSRMKHRYRWSEDAYVPESV